jgi:membrane-associated phospholipid phosphatase
MNKSAHSTMFRDIHEAPHHGSIFDPSPNGQAIHVAQRFHGPIRAWAATTVVSFTVVAAALIGLGLLLVAEILPEGLASWDRSIATWFVAQRTTTLNTATEIGSMLGSTFVVVGIAIVVGIALALRRHWREVSFLAAALLIEVGSFLAATFVVDRPRPTVPQLDIAPPTSSYPSGHTAAALVLYVGIAIVVWTLTDSRALRVLFWALAVLVPIFVALSRLYRGMHHASDVIASVLLAAASLACAVMATRVASAAATHPVREPEAPRTTVSHEVPA